jgi:hypothetical protein
VVGGRSPVRGLQRRHGFLAAAAGAFAAPFVDQTPGRNRQEPRPRVVRQAFCRPLASRREERILDGVLAGVELSMPPHQRAEDLRRELAQQVFDPDFHAQKSGGASITRRTSMGALMKATMREAISSARFSFSTSTIQ